MRKGVVLNGSASTAFLRYVKEKVRKNMEGLKHKFAVPYSSSMHKHLSVTILKDILILFTIFYGDHLEFGGNLVFGGCFGIRFCHESMLHSRKHTFKNLR